MKRYIEYQVGNKSIIIEVEDTAPGLVPAAGIGQVIAKAKLSFEQAIEIIGPIADGLFAKVCDITKPPDQIGMEFGLKLGIEAGAVIASGSTEANFKISLSWKREADPKK